LSIHAQTIFESFAFTLAVVEQFHFVGNNLNGRLFGNFLAFRGFTQQLLGGNLNLSRSLVFNLKERVSIKGKMGAFTCVTLRVSIIAAA
jgi:hypothetical protein